MTELADREAEVITLIAQRLSNREIADRQYVSVNSVRVPRHRKV